MMADQQVKVSHCPAAAMRMLGFAPIQEMQSAGVCVSLGTDGAPSNNRMSLGSYTCTLLLLLFEDFGLSWKQNMLYLPTKHHNSSFPHVVELLRNVRFTACQEI
jgi:cytosine/adenosine deaminase-related metal-dependent hydrolase